MPKIIFEDKIDPITCSEVESHVSIYYSSEIEYVFGPIGSGSAQYYYETRAIPHNITDYSIYISKNDGSRIRTVSPFRIINDSNETLYSNCRISHVSTENNVIKIYFRPSYELNFHRHQTIMFDTSNIPELENCRCHSHESCGVQPR